MREAQIYDVGDSVTLVAIFVVNPTKGSIDAGSNLLTVHDPTGYANGVTVVVAGAAVGGQNLVTTVSSVSGNVLTLAATAALSVIGAEVGRAVNPTTVSCKVRKPDKTTATLTTTNPSTGRFEAVFDPDQAGDHFYRFEGTGAAKAAGEEMLVVREKRVT